MKERDLLAFSVFTVRKHLQAPTGMIPPSFQVCFTVVGYVLPAGPSPHVFASVQTAIFNSAPSILVLNNGQHDLRSIHKSSHTTINNHAQEVTEYDTSVENPDLF